MSKLSFSFISKPKDRDTGLRGSFSGRLHVDKKVFYKRKDIQQIITGIKESETIRQALELNRAS